jgi:RNA polymerase sigma factor (sigma-70 family)
VQLATGEHPDGEVRLVELARIGRADAFNALVLQHQDLAYNVAYRLLGDADAAADVVQESFFSAWQHLSSFRGGSFRSWLLRIVTNGCYDAIRYRQRRPAASLDDLVDGEAGFDHSDPGDSPDRLVLRREAIAAIQSALLGLPVDQRAAVVLYDVQGLSYEEVAEIGGVSLGTVKSRISRGRARLRALLGNPRELLT